MAKKKFYVVWEGRKKGIYTSWNDCKRQVDGFEGAKYMSFENEKDAIDALAGNLYNYIGKKAKAEKKVDPNTPKPIRESVVVDAAWNTRSGDMEYQGFDFKTGKLLFRKGPYQDGTNNIGEFLAIVHALALLKKHNVTIPVYSDSKTAISWVRKKTANTKLERTPRNGELFELLQRAEEWLRNNTFANPVLKWDTDNWGENPADFGRK